jgi:hypothetical protein
MPVREKPMPLLDHFHPPLFPQRSWESFHSRWANSIADALNELLPERFVAEVQLHLGSQVEADVAEFERGGSTPPAGNGQQGALAVQTWAPPAITMVLSAVFPDDLEVHVRDQQDDARLVAVIELVSPRNKDRAESRQAFAAKSAAYLQRAIGLVVLDIVTNRDANLHNQLVDLLQADPSFTMSKKSSLYAVAYRPGRHESQNQIAAWAVPLSVGTPLPVMPLPLRAYGLVPLDLEATYQEARHRSRL